VDTLDYEIYRHLSRDGQIRFWASRRVIDPRVTAREIASQVQLSEAGVRLRLRHLRTQGLLRGSEVSLNPSLFGVSIAVAVIPVRSPRESERLRQDLEVADGIVFARDLLDEEERTVHVYYISDTAGATARRTSLLRRLAPNGEIRGPTPYWLPPGPEEVSRLDWRLLSTFRRDPDGSLGQFAAKAGVSQKTAARRFAALLDAHACWWSHSHDSEEWPLALLEVSAEPRTDPSVVFAAVPKRLDGWMPVAPDGRGVDPAAPPHTIVGLVPVERPAALERIVQAVLGVEGVANVRRTFGLASASYPAWIDEQLAARVPGR
jgi:DNA-binding Lrp family transcriptional regulator